jgi:hypothetical protein
MSRSLLLNATAALISVFLTAGSVDAANIDQPVADSESSAISASPFGCGGTHIALRTMTGHYVVAEGGGGGAVNANRPWIGAWETFTVHDLGGGQIALQTHNGSFVVAEGGGGREVKADRPWLGAWETFTLGRHWNGRSWTLRSHNGGYVVAEGGGGGAVNANRPGVGVWEAFDAVCLD